MLFYMLKIRFYLLFKFIIIHLFSIITHYIGKLKNKFNKKSCKIRNESTE